MCVHPFFIPNDKGEFHYIKNSQSPLYNVTYSFVRIALGNGSRSGGLSSGCGHIGQGYG